VQTHAEKKHTHTLCFFTRKCAKNSAFRSVFCGRVVITKKVLLKLNDSFYLPYVLLLETENMTNKKTKTIEREKATVNTVRFYLTYFSRVFVSPPDVE
jgi:hypothetical protein